MKAINPKTTHPKDNQCDVFGRLNIIIAGETKQVIDFENIESADFSAALRESINDKIKPILEFGLIRYFELFPMGLQAATLKAKKNLGINNN